MNSINSLRNLLPDSKRAGVYRLAIDSTAIVAAAKTAGLQVFKIDLAKARGKSGLFDAFSNTLKFPKQCGKNWAALNDCLTDLAWLNGTSWVLILANCKPFVARYQADFDVALELLEGVSASWQEDGKPFWLFIPDQPGWSADLPEIALG